MKKPSRVFNLPERTKWWDDDFVLALIRIRGAIYREHIEWKTGGTRFIDATAARRSGKFRLTD